MLRKMCIMLLMSLLYLTAQAQQKLVYRGVKLISTSQTVPNSRVWKVTSLLCNQFDVQNVNVSGMRMLVNGNSLYFVDRSGAPTSNNAFMPSALPMWLPAGTTVAPSTGVAFISIIEFEVVP